MKEHVVTLLMVVVGCIAAIEIDKRFLSKTR